MIQACSSVAAAPGGTGIDGRQRRQQPGWSVDARDDEADDDAQQQRVAQARGSRRARPGRGSPTLQPADLGHRAVRVGLCQTASPRLSGHARGGRSAPTMADGSGPSWFPAGDRRHGRPAAERHGGREMPGPRRRGQARPRSAICSGAGSRSGKSSRARQPNKPIRPSGGQRAGQSASNRMARRASSRRQDSRRASVASAAGRLSVMPTRSWRALMPEVSPAATAPRSVGGRASPTSDRPPPIPRRPAGAHCRSNS